MTLPLSIYLLQAWEMWGLNSDTGIPNWSTLLHICSWPNVHSSPSPAWPPFTYCLCHHHRLLMFLLVCLILCQSCLHSSISSHKLSSFICTHTLSLSTLFCTSSLTWSVQLVLVLSNCHVFTIFLFVLSKQSYCPCMMHSHTSVFLISLTSLVLFLPSDIMCCPVKYFKYCCYKNVWSFASTNTIYPQCVVLGHRDNFTSTFIGIPL
jgi:hypothetical protein